MRAYSVDLRQRVLTLVDAAELPRAAIAELLGVSRRWMDKMISQRRRLGHLAPLGHAGGAKTKLNAAGREELFVDETGMNTDLARTHARAPRGERAVDHSVPRNTPTRTGLVGAMGAEGMICAMQVDGAVDGDAFSVFLEKCLGPHLRRGDFVVMDNLSTHTNARVEAAIYARGAFLLFLPRYSPDMNPIEGAWSKLKAHLRRVAARTADKLDAALAEGLAAITAADAHGWFTHAGYAL